MLFHKLIFFGLFIFITKCLTITEADYVKLNNSERLKKTAEEIKNFNLNEASKLFLSERQSTPLTNSDSELETTTISSIITAVNGFKTNQENFNIETQNSTIKNNATFEHLYEEMVTTQNPIQTGKFRISTYYENNQNYQAALVIPETPRPVSEAATSTTEKNVAELNPDLQNKTISSTPRILTLEEQCHPIIFDFILRIRRANLMLSNANETSSQSESPTVHPVDMSLNIKNINNPKYKYFEDFYRIYLNITDLKKPHRNSSLIRAYYADKKFPSAIDYSQEDNLIQANLNTKNDGPSPRIPFNTKDYYSPKYKQLSKFHYDFFPRYVDGKLIVPIHA